MLYNLCFSYLIAYDDETYSDMTLREKKLHWVAHTTDLFYGKVLPNLQVLQLEEANVDHVFGGKYSVPSTY